MAHRLLELMLDAAHGIFPPADGTASILAAVSPRNAPGRVS